MIGTLIPFGIITKTNVLKLICVATGVGLKIKKKYKRGK